MIFEQENLQFQLLDVLYFEEADLVCKTPPRPFCALSLRLAGDTEIELPNESIYLEGGNLAFFPPNIGYVRHAKEDKMIVFHFTLLDGEMPSGIQVLRDCRYDVLLPLFEGAMETWNEKHPGYRYHASAFLYRIFGELQLQPIRVEKRNQTVENAVAYILANIADPALTVAALAKHLYISETYLRRIFQQEKEVSPKQFISSLRLERAKVLLNAGYDPVGVIAEKVGFRDAKNFATAFKKAYGYPPSCQNYGKMLEHR